MLIENVPAPGDARVWPEAVALRDAGYQVTVISPKGSTSSTEAQIRIDGIPIYRYRLPSGYGIRSYLAEYAISLIMTFWLSLKVWRRHGFDVIHAANPPDMFFLIGLFYRLFGKKYVFDQHDLTPELFGVLFGTVTPSSTPRRFATILHRLLLWLERCSYQTATLVIVTNDSFERNAWQRGRCRDGKVVVVRNGPDLNRFRLAPPDPALKMGRRYLLAYVGVMAPQDGVENALEALHRLVVVRGRRDVGLVLMGRGPSLDRLRALAHDLGLDDYVHFNGLTPKAEVPRFLAAADVGLVPDPQNGMNEFCTIVKTMEYMAMAKPVVGFDLAETRASAGDAGLYARANSVDAFADCIERLLDDEALRTTMGRFGRRRVEETLSWQHSSIKLVAAYARCFGAIADERRSAPPDLEPEAAAVSSTDSRIELSRGQP
jgi:glycosyltransferase involved in cell wall biosynthesis